MGWQYHPLLLVFFAGGFVALGIAAFCWRYSRRHGFSYLVAGIGLLGFHDSIWTFAAALKTASTGLGAKLLFYKLEFLGSWVAPSLSVVIALALIGWDRWLGRRMLVGLAAVPVAGIVLVFVNPRQVMIADPVVVRAGGVLALEHSFPPLFVLFLAWSMGLATLAALLVGHGGLRGVLPWQPALLGTLVFLLPVVVLSLKATAVYPAGGEGINVTPAANAVALGVLGFTVVNYRIFELLPVGRYRAVEVMPDGYVLVGPHETVLDANRAAADLLGCPPGGVLEGTPIEDLVPVADRRPGSDGSDETLFDADGRTLEVRSSTVTRQHGTAGRLLLLRDVTDRHERERQLEETNERLDQFASIVSHDLRNPLNVAQARLEFIREEHESEHLQPAADALKRMGTLIGNVLTLARLGKSISDPERVSLAWVANGAWDVIDTHESELVVERDVVFEADGERLQQLLENLFRNAVEHGGSDVTVLVGALDDGTGFYVADDGVGIPEDEREDVLASGYSTSASGTGLGLAIVEEIVSAHGWTITVTGGPDGGARFEITNVDPTDRPTTASPDPSER